VASSPAFITVISSGFNKLILLSVLPVGLFLIGYIYRPTWSAKETCVITKV